MKIVTILGTRPEIIRLSLIIEKLDKFAEHRLVHTGQNFDKNLDEIFFSQLGVRKPDYHFGALGTFAQQFGKILVDTEVLLKKERPDRVLILGDTNSGLAAVVAKRMGIPVYHMEAGNRCYDDRVPEETNRRIIDHSSTILMPYTERSRQNLIKEGIEGQRIYVTGNPIKEVLDTFAEPIEQSDVLKRLKLKKGSYFLITLHRAENVDEPRRLRSFLKAFELLVKKYKLPIIWSVHPRTRSKLNKSMRVSKNIKLLEPLGLFDFVKLQKNAHCVLSDSGTVQEECCIFFVPTVTLRDVTERPETVECGSNIISGSDPDSIYSCLTVALARSGNWVVPEEYLRENVSDTVCKILHAY